MTKYKIEKSIPFPENMRNLGLSATLREMEIGDSILYPSYSSGKSVSSRVGASIGAKFTVRKEGTGCRVWRVL